MCSIMIAFIMSSGTMRFIMSQINQHDFLCLIAILLLKNDNISINDKYSSALFDLKTE